MKNILVTGGLGFIGGNFLLYASQKYPNYNFVNLDKETYAANLELKETFSTIKNIVNIKGDIVDFDLVDGIFKEYSIDGVIHFAAESHVDNSINGPRVFFESNVMGTYNLIDCARRHWIEKPGVPKSGFESARFHHVSTDEVFGSLDVDGYFNENTPYNPKNPYSASKAGSDFIVKSFAHTYGMNTVVTNCSNNYGPWQNNEKLIPTIISKAISGKEIPIYGDGSNIRDWLHVTNHCYAIDKVFHQGANNETYNVGTWNEVSNLDLAQKICEILDDVKGKNNGVSYKDQIRFVADRPGHDRRYAIDASKLEKELGYSAKMSFDEGLKETIQWYLNRSNTCENTL